MQRGKEGEYLIRVKDVVAGREDAKKTLKSDRQEGKSKKKERKRIPKGGPAALLTNGGSSSRTLW